MGASEVLIAIWTTALTVAPAGQTANVMRHTTFRFALAPSPVQEALLARHAGAARFAYNPGLAVVTDALAAKHAALFIRLLENANDRARAAGRSRRRSRGRGST